MDQAQMQQVESICQRFYNATSEEDRRVANQQLMNLGLQVAQCLHLLEHSNQEYALMVAASCLVDLAMLHVGESWTDTESTELRDQIIGFIFSRGAQMPKSVTAVLCKALLWLPREGGHLVPHHLQR